VPLFHILGLLMSYAYLCRGATVCLPANYKPDTLVREIDAYRVSDMAAVGAIYLGLAEAEGFEANLKATRMWRPSWSSSPATASTTSGSRNPAMSRLKTDWLRIWGWCNGMRKYHTI